MAPKSTPARLASILAAALVLSNCLGGGAYGPLGAACPQMTRADPLAASYSANARANAKVAAFVAASADLVNVSVAAEALAADACRRMGRDLGVADAAMTPAEASTNGQPGASAQAACSAVRARIDEILRAGVQVRVDARPPECHANLDAKARCDGVCSASVDPGAIVANCEPARLSGTCQGRCVGQCDGTCQGDCQGQCSAKDASGRCVGRCQGTCNGGCDATCHVKCEGAWQAPRCEGYVKPPSAEADCTASCSARANFEAQCTPGAVNVEASQNTEQVLRLVATLRANLPDLLKAEIGLGKRLVNDARAVVQIGSSLPRALGDAGAEAIACVAAAGDASLNASVRIDVSVRASASVTSRVGANAG